MQTPNPIPATPEPPPQNPPDPQAPSSTAPDSGPPAHDSATQETSLTTWRHNGKVARLPKAVRDQINLMIQDGVPYPAIIHQLGPAGHDLNAMNLSRWKDGGYQDWLLEQAWLAHTRARQEPAADLSTDFDATSLNHAALQLGTLHIFEALRDLNSPPSPCPPSIPATETAGENTEPCRASEDASTSSEHQVSPQRSHRPGDDANDEPENPGSPRPSDGRETSQALSPHHSPDQARNRRRTTVLDQKLGGDSAAFVRLINALARASRETMLVQKYRDACAQARAVLKPMLDPKRKLTQEERRHLILQVDEILGLPPQIDRSTLPPANPPPATDPDGPNPGAPTTAAA